MNFHYNKVCEYHLNEDYVTNPEKYCEICTLKLDDKSINLSCKHTFHYDCLMSSMQTSDYKHYNMQCPYCREKIPYIPLLNGQIPIRNLHKEYNEYVKKENSKYEIGKKVYINLGKYTGKYGIVLTVADKTISLLIEKEEPIPIRIKKSFITLDKSN